MDAWGNQGNQGQPDLPYFFSAPIFKIDQIDPTDRSQELMLDPSF